MAGRTVCVALLLTVLAGCGNSGLVKMGGHLEDNGKSVSLSEGEAVQIDFSTADGAYPPLSLGIYAKPNGTFEVDMNDGTGRGLPPGKYKVKLNSEGTTIKVKVNGKLFKESHTIEVPANGSAPHLTIDLGKGEMSP